MNYFQDNNPFFQPSVHNLGKSGTGKAISDFPLIYFLIAQLWKIFGIHEFIYRLVILVIFFFGLFALFKIFENTLKDSVLGILFSLLLFTSPVTVYYANNFLLDIPSLSLAIIGLYFFFKFYESSKSKHFYLFISFFILAGLLKITSLVTFIAIFVLFILELSGIKIGPGRKIFQHPQKQFLLIISVLIIQFIWYLYAINYNAKCSNNIFLIRALPIWKISIPEIMAILASLNHHVKNDYFRQETQLVFIFMFISVLIFYKKSSKMLLLLTIGESIGFLCFIILFFEALKRHDYYVLNQFILMQIILISFLLLLKKRLPLIYNSLIFRIVIVLFVIYNLDFAKRDINKRYAHDGWQNQNYIENLQTFDEIKPYLNSIGIKPDDKVISLPDYSFNVSLYKMNRKGWTNYGIGYDSAQIKVRIDLGAKYLFVSKKKVSDNHTIGSFTRNKAGEYKDIEIYKLY